MTPHFGLKRLSTLGFGLLVALLGAAGAKVCDLAVGPLVQSWWDRLWAAPAVQPAAPAVQPAAAGVPPNPGVRLRVDREDRSYLPGEVIEVHVLSDGPVVLFARSADGRVSNWEIPGELRTPWRVPVNFPAGRLELTAVPAPCDLGWPEPHTVEEVVNLHVITTAKGIEGDFSR